MHVPSIAPLCFCTLAALVSGSPGGRWPIGLGMSKYVSSFLGGAVINVNQTETTGKEDKLPSIRTVSAEWNVPWGKASDNIDLSNPNNRHSLAQWVGILGNGCANKNWYPFLQAGTNIEMDEHGATVAGAWVEWFPAGAHPIPKEGFAVSPGDQIIVVVNVYTRILGHVYMKNLRTGQEYAAEVEADSPEDPKFQICLGSGVAQFFQEWVIAKDRADLPIFSNVTFSSMTAIDRRGEFYDLTSGTEDYWTMIDAGRQVAIPENIDSKSFIVYSPQGRTWTPRGSL
ncbi:concanavalin A-like lectin/glucanase [Daldinia decipiens]|uniref:concanavalin A-like lectin/glucanase n=1 Tax=Daldinia decipiens TaxID=326647 RepID=UPI0020C1C698|nr:concanavalin A-like lectin/glucanase [Daldinia decipiens]KAI1654649.1 concanavalin A-like lectin/glucanase [Daldinia decipiens]